MAWGGDVCGKQRMLDACGVRNIAYVAGTRRTSCIRWLAAGTAFACLALAAPASAGMSFNNGKLVDSGNREIGMALGNFTGDAYPDVITANSNNTADLMVNRTDDWFFQAGGWPKAISGSGASVVAGDFDANGDLDAAFVGISVDNLDVFLGDGTGGVTATASYPTGSGPFDVATADVDGDDDLDLVTANQANTVPTSPPSVSVYLGNGDGTFTSVGDYATGGNAAITRGLAIGDVTGDGEKDIVAVNLNTNNVVILVGDGNGAFALSPTSYNTTNGPRKVVLGDFDENGSLDIATADSGDGVPAIPANRNNKITVLLNDGSGNFTAASGSPFTSGPSQSSPFAIRTVDFDGDGHLDLATVNRFNSSLSVLRGVGDGGFETTMRLGYPEFDPLSPPEATDLVVGDTNQDGRPDLIGNAAGSPGFLISFLNTTTVDAPTVSATSPASPSNDNSPEVTGTAGDNETIRLYTTSNCDSGSQVGSGSENAFESTGITATVPSNTTSTIYAQATNAAGWGTSGCSSTSVSYTHDSVPPDAPTVTDSDPDSPSNENNPVFNGSVEDGATIKLYSNAACTTQIGDGSAADFESAVNGTGVDLDSPFAADSNNDVYATATDAAGNPSGCSTPAFEYVEDSTGPAAPTGLATTPASPSRTDTTPQVSGSAAADAVTVRIYETADCTGGFTDGSKASFEVGGIEVTVDPNVTTQLSAKAVDTAGNPSTACSASISYTHDSIAPAAPVIVNTNPASPSNVRPISVQGTADPDVVTISLYRTSDCTETNGRGDAVAALFTGSGMPLQVPANQTTQLSAKAYDAAGNLSTCSNSISYTHDDIAPSAPTGLATNPASPSADTTPQVTGSVSAADADKVRVYKSTDCSGGFTEGPNATFEAAGIEVTVDANDTTQLSAQAVDAAGNVDGCSASISYTHDSIAPATPTGLSASPASPSMNDTTPQVSGSAAADADRVRIYETADCTGGFTDGPKATFESSGIEVTVDPNVTTQLSAKAVDAAGNPSTACSASISYTHDSIAPAAPTIISTNPASPSSDSVPRVLGTAAADVTHIRVHKTSDCGVDSTSSGLKASFEAGTFAVPVPLNQTSGLAAKAVDAAGNHSVCGNSIPYTHDSIGPDAPTGLATTPASPSRTDTTPQVSGLAAADAVTVRIYKSNDCSGGSTDGTKATFESAGIEVTVDPNDTTQLSAQAVDAAGNPSAACSTSISYTHDSIAPDAPTITDSDPDSPSNVNNPVINGAAEDGTTIKLYSNAACATQIGDGSAADFESAANGTGVDLDAPFAPNSSNNVFATATDPAGNTSPCSNPPYTYVEDSSAPTAPTGLSITPASPADDTTPLVKGSAPADANRVRVYETADCTGTFTDGSKATFEGAGIEVTVAANQTTQLSAAAVDQAGNESACSASIAYTEDSAAPGAPTSLATTPASPSDDASPLVRGTADADTDRVRVFTSADCSGPFTEGTRAAFEGGGIEVTVAAETTTQLTARAVDALGHASACSAAIAYRHATPVVPPPEDPNDPTDGPDAIGGTDAGDVIDGLDGDDEIFGAAGDDLLDGGQGADELQGGLGDDEVRGGDGDDTLRGGKGDDELIGGPGDDDLDGGPGEDSV